MTVSDWASLIDQESGRPYWAGLQDFVATERARYSVYPAHDQVFTALNLTPLAETKVVILGQDPYPGAGLAHGLAFSVPRGVRVPSSLRNIYRELHDDVCEQIPDHGSLESWAHRGVLLLNVTMTVREGVRGSHRGKGWERFTDQVIRTVDKKPDRVVFILWGKYAQRKSALIDKSRHTVICSSHPSPISAYRGRQPFFGSRPFSRANDALVGAGRGGIDWSLRINPRRPSRQGEGDQGGP